MPTVLVQLFDRLRKFYQELKPQHRRGLVYAAVVVASSLGLLALVWTYQPYGVLFHNLEPAEAASVVEYLKGSNIPYRLSSGGRSIEIPEDRIHESRIQLAKDGPVGQVSGGFEILDQVPFGASDFSVRMRHRRALEGELARTITTIDGIRGARVHLSLPERSIFENVDKQPSASVVLNLDPGRNLNREEVRGISNLVGNAVEGLVDDQVTIVNARGRILAGGTTNEADAMGTEKRRSIEKQLEDRVVSLLEPVVGRGRVTAQISVELDETSLVETEKLFQPERTAIVSEERSEEERNSGTDTGGVAGAQANNPAAGLASIGANNTSGRSAKELTNYEVSVTTRRVERGIGSTKRISAAVMVGAKRIEDSPGSGTFSDQELTPVELEQLKNAVQGAIGFNADRGDVVEIVSMPFLEETPAPEAALAWLPQLIPLLKIAGVVLVALALLLLVLRPAWKASRRMLQDGGTTVVENAARTEFEELEDVSSAGALPAPSESMQNRRERAMEAALEGSEQAAEIVRAWLASDDTAEQDRLEAEQQEQAA